MKKKFIKSVKIKITYKGKPLTFKQFIAKFKSQGFSHKFLAYCYINKINPSILKSRYNNLKKFWRTTLRKPKCARCQMNLQTSNHSQSNYATCDHINPKSKMPHLYLSISNYQPMCLKCNQDKASS